MLPVCTDLRELSKQTPNASPSRTEVVVYKLLVGSIGYTHE
jgi:hypothetical protein